MDTRRSFLRFAMLSGAAGIAGFIPDSIQRAYAIEPDEGSSYLDAEHIVILMQENRSFDHTFGTLRGVRGFDDPRAIRLPNANSVFVQTDAAGNSFSPWRLDIRDTRITWMGSLPHSRNSQVDAWHDGLHDRWIEAKRSGEYPTVPLTMGYYTREDLPFYYALADAFTVCDQNYCSVMTSTSPNRSFFWSGTIRDQKRTDSRVFMRNEQYEGVGMTWKTFPERLQEAGIRWKSYQNELTHAKGLTGEQESWLANFGDNVLEYFAAFHIEAQSGNSAASYEQLTDRERALHDAAFVTNVGDPHYRSLEELMFSDRNQQRTMMVPKGDVLHQFRQDVNDGKLPAISWLTAPENFSDHPSAPWYGAWYVSEVMDILTKNPDIWKKTIFILTYDENDGYFDHAPSFVGADPKRPETGGASAGIDTGLDYTYFEDELAQGVSKKDARSGPIGMGFRVPMIIASPWSRGGWVNSQLFDHTSTLMFLEKFVQSKYGKTVKEENMSDWRRCVSGDLVSVFRSNEKKTARLEYLERDRFVIGIQRARYREIPSNYQKLDAKQIENINNDWLHSKFHPHQEAGIRPACALPYELYADGGLSTDRTKFTLRLRAGNAVHGNHSAGAPFNVYLRDTAGNSSEPGSQMCAATYAVKAGDTLEAEFPLARFANGRYSVEVLAPNGFYRSFEGDAEPSSLQVRTGYEQNGSSLSGNVQVTLENTGERALAISVDDHSYGMGSTMREVKPGQSTSIVLDSKRSHGWYDFSVKTGNAGPVWRFAGRVETGHASFSDPFMGGAIG
jgi:phospholipase C